MPNIYTLRQKEHAVYIIKQLGGDIPAASRHLDIPERTLRDWWNKASYGIPELHPRKNPTLAYNGDRATMSLELVRDHLILQLETLIGNPTDNPRDAYYTALAVDRFLNQIRTINNALDITPPPPLPEAPEQE